MPARRYGRAGELDPDGFVGEMFALVERHPPAPGGLRSPVEWGTADRLRELLPAARLTTARREYVLKAPSAEDYVDFMAVNFGPIATAIQALEPTGRAERLRADLVDLCRHHTRPGAALAIPASYLQALATTI